MAIHKQHSFVFMGQFRNESSVDGLELRDWEVLNGTYMEDLEGWIQLGQDECFEGFNDHLVDDRGSIEQVIVHLGLLLWLVVAVVFHRLVF